MLSGQANPGSVDSLRQDNLLEQFIEKPWNEEALFDAVKPILEKIR